jgi:molybdopterin-guanine dinucleotide biosynthesis protein B
MPREQRRKRMPPIVSIIGKSKTGKTTLIEKLIQELKARDYRVATIKHVPQDSVFDEPNKDSWRHVQAGSEITAISSPDKVVLIKPVAKSLTVDEVARYLGEDYDIILAEGFKKSSAPKIEVHRQEVGPPLDAINKLFAIVTDEPLETKTRQFSPEDIKGLADLLEQGFIKPQRQRTVLYVNNTPITLTAFPNEFLTNTLLGMASSLKGVGQVRTLEIFLRQEPD